MRKLMIVLALMVAAFAGWWLGSPYWTLHQMQVAVRHNDSARLSQFIDYSAVRDNLKAEARSRILKEIPADGDGKGFATLGSAIAAVMINPLIDTLVTPEGLQVALARRSSDPTPGKGPRLPGTPDKPVIDHRGLDAFAVHDRNHDQGSLVFHRFGLGWKLVGFELPKEGDVS